MYEITRKVILNDAAFEVDVYAPRVAKKAQPGQFIIARVGEDGERIPLTIGDYDREKGTITLVIQAVGFSTKQMAKLEVGDSFTDFVGPLGEPTKLNPEWKHVIGVAGGIGSAPVYPQLRALAEMGVHVDVIIGGRAKQYVLWADKFAQFCDHVYIATDNGEVGTKGFVTNVLQDRIDAGDQIDCVIAIGPVIMMKNVVRVTKPHNIATSVSLNPIMVDGTGMCGCCRVTVDGKVKFACVDGPDFDGLNVDFDQLMERQRFFKKEEKYVDEHADRICDLMRGVE
ncbi:sulfide/dihydroorotate dehydrogenase-like FAD/NAD-binding protein [Intestinibaculum porci]|jgi:NAD(P)H-flavin reductase|uniref:Ferredoxin-NADP+ reductase subunit alpha n=1 Tax=Intestinibaculum porci TaxID=2487118 RepID=A0A3G9JBL3_9FIRM|nr:sulfide/dihydroorotate dehydrogenase-like FAD/NAD-binding protein [Intestinibaculum porci]MDD6349425.1 sulfide/dihydroorotate dehydrogenase-like FAD/NAD-binding protein [Intestinibaculum porci]MDD6422842.1 sulfide/dihydroorotate dehydrogenase-like FAD/NAD-binding protein [Intestinibaculum porci]BBH25745.1 ferredoxin-NADP+ reductase subunit alpha [Intestinibaculum porci]HAN59053.1 sulfide/dihydroorotate dehydrogenase-like FAD/NAD-binding protein [Erysipelotrichaceae bacterium]